MNQRGSKLTSKVIWQRARQRLQCALLQYCKQKRDYISGSAFNPPPPPLSLLIQLFIVHWMLNRVPPPPPPPPRKSRKRVGRLYRSIIFYIKFFKSINKISEGLHDTPVAYTQNTCTVGVPHEPTLGRARKNNVHTPTFSIQRQQRQFVGERITSGGHRKTEEVQKKKKKKKMDGGGGGGEGGGERGRG